MILRPSTGLFNLEALINDGLVSEELGSDEKARVIYLAHHEGLGGARGFLRGTGSYTFSNLACQVGRTEAQACVDAADGDTTKAYRNWLNGYMDRHIQPSKFRKAGIGTLGGVAAGKLSQFDGPPVHIDQIGDKPELVKAIQWRLTELGYLDPPADGVFGPVSQWALSEFADQNGISLTNGFSKATAQQLLSPTHHLPEIVGTGTWIDKIISYMKNRHYFICRHPDCKNIIYIEGVNVDGTLNDDAPNAFNALRMVFSIDANGAPRFKLWDATTRPGAYWTAHPMRPGGAAIIAFDQYKAWGVGTHHPASPQAHEALVQTAPVKIYRDLKKDYKREGQPETGIFGINQHWGYDLPKGDLGRSSAGCLVGRTREGHRQFMALVKDDPRYKVSQHYKFVTAIVPGDKALSER